jgi:hypothetical protein
MATQALGRCTQIPLIAKGPELSRAANDRTPFQQSCKKSIRLKWVQNAAYWHGSLPIVLIIGILADMDKPQTFITPSHLCGVR